MALVPRILLTCSLLALPIEIVSIDRSPGSNRHESSNHRLLWPIWFHEKLSRDQRDRESGNFQRSNANAWNREGTLAEAASSTVVPRIDAFRHHVAQRLHEQSATASKSEKLSAVAVAEYAGTRAIAYTGYHNNHRHQPRDTATQSYQYLATTPSTYTKHHPGRRVCTRSLPSTAVHHHRNGQIRYLNIINIKTDSPSVFLCCPGWTQTTHLSFGCNKPTCPAPCLNGGVCTSPGRCRCPKGFTGNQCQTDVDECVTEKPCDQLCRNLPGTYECHCKPGFQLQKDGQSCRKNDTEDTAFEARDLEDDFHEPTTTRRPSISSHDTENEVTDGDLDQDYEIILKRLTKLEKQFAKGRKRDTDSTEMSIKVASIAESINEMKKTVESMHYMKQEIHELQSKLRQYELETRKTQHLTNRVIELENRLRLRCRATMPMNGGTLNF